MDDIDKLRKVVAWADGQPEDYWFPAPPRKPPTSATVIAIYDAVHFLGSNIEEITAERLPFAFSSYTRAEREAINVVRTSLGLKARQ